VALHTKISVYFIAGSKRSPTVTSPIISSDQCNSSTRERKKAQEFKKGV